MKFGFISKLSIFLSSYFLLFIALAIKNFNEKFFWLLSLISLISLLATLYLLKRKINPDTSSISSIENKNDQVVGYLVTYLLPFVGFNMSKPEDIVALIILFTTICILYIKSGLIYINPTLMLLGFNIYEVKFQNQQKRILISKNSLQELRRKENIEFYEFDDRFIIIERRNI